jgi:hypothetical protein
LDVAVDRDARVGMAKLFLCFLGSGSGFDEQAGVGVAEGVEAAPQYPELVQNRPEAGQTKQLCA